jgi:hypothetical protein
VNGDRVEDETLKIALTAYENARMDGLCHEGAWECAITAVSPTNPENNAQWVAQLKQQLQEPLSC